MNICQTNGKINIKYSSEEEASDLMLDATEELEVIRRAKNSTQMFTCIQASIPKNMQLSTTIFPAFAYRK